MPEALLASSRRDPLPVLVAAIAIVLVTAAIAWPAPRPDPTSERSPITQTALADTRPAASHLTGPSHPENLTAEAGPGAGEITLDWDPPHHDGGSPIAYYKVYRDGTWIADTPDTGYLDTGLGDGETHHYSIAAVNEDGETSEPCDLESATTYDLPGEPRDLTAEGGIGRISLAWDPPADDGGTNVTAYHVYADGSHVATVEDLSYVHDGLGDGKTHSYRVSAENLVGEGPLSTATSATTLDRPTAPRNLSASAGPGIGEISIAWDRPADDGGTNVTAYRIYRDDRMVAETASRSFVDTGLSNGTRYTYRVSAVNEVGEGPRSQTADAETYSQPSGIWWIVASPGPQRGQISVHWAQPRHTGGLPIDGYRVHRDGEAIATVEGQTFVDTGLGDGETHTYRVSAVNEVGDGPLSEPVTATTWALPEAPEDVEADPAMPDGDRPTEVVSIELTWTAPADDGGLALDRYRIYRGRSPDDLSPLTSVDGDVTRYVDRNLDPTASYVYRVQAINGLGASPLSEQTCSAPFPWLERTETVRDSRCADPVPT